MARRKSILDRKEVREQIEQTTEINNFIGQARQAKFKYYKENLRSIVDGSDRAVLFVYFTGPSRGVYGSIRGVELEE